MAGLSGQMVSSADYKMFAGAGSYQHYIPEVTRYLLSRSEFVTAYTPYQPEISQGTLQGIFEYQTLVCRLLGMDVANASLYDGAMSVAEALLMAIRIGRKKHTVAVSSLVNPYYRKVVETSGRGGRAVAQLLRLCRRSGRGRTGHPRSGGDFYHLFQ